MITISAIYIAFILIVIWAIYRILVLKKSKEKNILREVTINLFFIYFLILINLTIFKMGMLQISFQNQFYINYIPFIETIKMFQDNFMGIGNAIYNIVGNILLFVPLGFFIPLLFNKKNKVINIALYGFFISFIIEGIQLFTAFNLTDIDDIIFNTLGSVVGFLIFKIFYYTVKKTKVNELVRKVASNFDGNLIILIIKPVCIMFGVVLSFIIIIIFNSTISVNTSNEEIAKTVFKYSNNSDFELAKDTLGYKFFLKDEGDYVNLIQLDSVFNTRWFDSRHTAGQYSKNNGDYSICRIYENTLDEENVSMTIIVFGKNKVANKIEINFNGKNYSEEIEPNEYFIVTFPTFEHLKNSDIDNIYNDEESKDLKIEFIDLNGNNYTEMKFSN